MLGEERKCRKSSCKAQTDGEKIGKYEMFSCLSVVVEATFFGVFCNNNSMAQKHLPPKSLMVPSGELLVLPAQKGLNK